MLLDTPQLQLKHLPEASQEKVRLYKSILKGNEDKIPFWDVVVLSSGDEEQKTSYRQQITLKKSRNEIPGFVKYVVTCDPKGAKIGNGGATMHVLEQLQAEMNPEQLTQAKVIMIHAGGFSQRLPTVSVIGKAFMALPCGDDRTLFHMLDAILITYIDIPARMNPGVFMTASDVIFLHNERGDWDMKQVGITAIAHPASIDVATTHGVFILQDMESVAAKYSRDPDQPCMMAKAKRFLHKSPRKTLESSGAKIPGSDQVYVDLGYYFDWPTAEKLVKFYTEHKPLKCELDAYGDFLQALGPEASSDYCSNSANVTFVTEDLVGVRRNVYEMLQGTPLNVAIFNQAQFNHVGTTAEYLHHLFSNPILSQSLGFQAETMVAETGVADQSQPEPVKRAKRSFEDCVLVHSVLRNRSSVSIGEESVVEYCVIEPQVSIGNKCLVSNLHLPRGVSIPDCSFLHTVALSERGRIGFATFAFDIHDSMKASVSRENAGKLQYCNRDLAEAMKLLGSALEEVLPEDLSKFSLWNSRLFPVFSTREESAKYAVQMIQRLKDSTQPLTAPPDGHTVCVADMLRLKSVPKIGRAHV